MPTKLFTQHLDQDSSAALDLLAHSNIQTLMSRWCDVEAGSSILTVSSVSIPLLDGRFVVIKNDWADTPKDALDYYFLSARITSAPHDISFNPHPKPGEANFIGDHLSLNLGAAAQVKKIDVLALEEKSSEEAVHYDAGLLITREDGLKVAVVRAADSITGFLRIGHKGNDVKDLLSGLNVRLSFGA